MQNKNIKRIKPFWSFGLLSWILLFTSQHAYGFLNSPKIITKNGNLIFESGLNRNISIRLNGKSSIVINDDLDLLYLLTTTSKRGRSSSGSNGDVWSDTSVHEVDLRQLASEVSNLKKRMYAPLNEQLQSMDNRTRISTRVLRGYRSRLRRVERRLKDITDQLGTDNCKSNPCENGGTCFNTFSGFQCKCSKQFEGPTCGKDVNECAIYAGTDLGCQNGAQCVNQFGGYSCICMPSWYGIHCTQSKGDCMLSSNWELCGHGTCVKSSDNSFGYKCICDQGWKTNGLTPSCGIDVDECVESHTACTTKCINLPGSFSCTPCGPGLTGNGIACRDIDECATLNGGCSTEPLVPCINTYGSSHCGECPMGWSGDGRSCTRASSDSDGRNNNAISGGCAGVNICHPSATCTEISNTVVCTCPTNMFGNGIGRNGCTPRPNISCNSRPCLNGGTCQDDGSYYKCICPTGFMLPNCLKDPCQPNPCHNDGVCQVIGIDLQVHCQCPPGYMGRLCDTRRVQCGGRLVGGVGSLRYPLANLYDHNAQCAWIIRTNETSVLNITFNAFELEDSTECRFDWLQLNDGNTAASQIIGRFCGNHKPFGGNIITSTHQVYLWFRSDNSSAKAGFDLSWNSIPPQCGGIIDVSSHGTIATPGSPGVYPKNRDCHWQLRAPNNKRLKLTFFSLQIENHDSCNYDFVEIIDSASNMVLEKFCNSSHPVPLILPTNEATVHFHSDNEGSDTGFQIYYSTEPRVPGCGGTFTSKTGTIRSPDLVDGSTITCEYDIKLPQGELLTFKVVKFNMGPEDCIEAYDINSESQKLDFILKLCGNYMLPPEFNSTYNAVQIKYYSKGGKFELSYRSVCSYTFDSNEGEILSPNYPTLRNLERTCTYKIITPPNTVIELQFIDLNLEDSTVGAACASTYLEIIDGFEDEPSARFCGSTAPSQLVSDTNMLTLDFRTTTNSHGRGFKSSYKSIPMNQERCGGIYNKVGHTIRLKTESGTYQHNLECNWVIVAPPGRGILINWNSFKVEYSQDCSYDYLLIFDDSDHYLDKYCGSNIPPAFLSHSNILRLKFVSDFSEAMDGFEATYDFVAISDNCGGDIHSSSGKIVSPQWNHNYTDNINCTWIITAPVGTQIELQIESFDLASSEDCQKTFLEVRNGGSAKSQLIGSYCGRTIPHTMPSYTNQMRLYYHSDSLTPSAGGFAIRWHVFANSCGGRLTGQTGVITSPLYPNPYPQNSQCIYHIRVAKGSAIYFSIDDISMEEYSSCNYDYLNIHDGRSINDLILLHACQLDDNKKLETNTSGNEALVEFVTDSSNNERGFLLTFYTNCTRTLIAMNGIIESPNYINSDFTEDINCSWTIKAPKGNRILLEFTHFTSVDTNAELILIGQNQNSNESHTEGIKRMISRNSTWDSITIIQNTSMISFRLEYTMAGCVHRFLQPTGSIFSPSYPNPYPNNVECFWEIITSFGQGIEIDVWNLDIQQSTNCTKDALIISSDINSQNHKEWHCGVQPILLINSSDHHMYIRFFSDNAYNGHGFNISYRTAPAKCGGYIISKNGFIQSPNYPMNYPPNSDCEWTIEVSPFHTISLTLEELDIEDFFNCEMDYLLANDNFVDEEMERRLFKKCGTLSEIGSNTWKSRSNLVTIRFKTDDSIQSKGFKLTFEENCGSHIVVKNNDDFDSTFGINKFTKLNETCIWTLEAENEQNQIILTPLHSQLNPFYSTSYISEEDCAPKGVKIYNGVNRNVSADVKFCKTHPPAITSTGTKLTIEVPLNVVSDFSAQYSLIDETCGGLYNSITGKFGTPNNPSPFYGSCEWIITASDGNSIVLTIESMRIQSSDDCNENYLEVRQTDERGELLGIFCENTPPPPLTAAKTLWIKFYGGDDVEKYGGNFLASYNYAHHNEINGTNGIIESPKYPARFDSSDSYSWRITVDRNYVVLLNIEHILDVDTAFIKFYDGYSTIGAEIPYANSYVIQSHTNLLYMTATRGPFRFKWEQLSKEAIRSNATAEEMAKVCGKETLKVNNRALLFRSPGYPRGYAPNLKCVWTILPENMATHAVIQLLTVDLEDYEGCFADNIRISSSSDLTNWSEEDKLCKMPSTSLKSYNGKPYLKLEFTTDSSLNNTGFSVFLKSACGSELNEPSGFVNITNLATMENLYTMECIWTIKVRQGRRILLTFPDSYLQTPNRTVATTRTYFLIRNGISEDSPFLGKGKYYENNMEDVLESSSNRMYVKFVRFANPSVRASFQYEEISHQCSRDLVLSEGSSKIITSPNYPNIPQPHSECVWKITAPDHHVISIAFLDKFDIASGTGPMVENCDREFIQLNDGLTEIMPLIGRFCGTSKPNTAYTTSNSLRLTYFTDIVEPHPGFKAQVSIGRCGGMYYSNEGVISPPDFTLQHNETEFECVYRIDIADATTINITLNKFQFRDDWEESSACDSTTRLIFEETVNHNGEDNVTDILVLCENREEGREFIVESNILIIRHKIVKDSNDNRDKKALARFSISYVANGGRCGETIVAPMGILQTPGYPNGINRPSHCIWRLKVPKGRRIKIEFLDFDTGSTARGRNEIFPIFHGRVSFANDFGMQSIIQRISSNPPAQLYSTDNTMAIEAFLFVFGRHRGFKLRFSSNETSEECRSYLTPGLSGRIDFHSNTNSTVYCNYNLAIKDDMTFAFHVEKIQITLARCAISPPLRLRMFGQILMRNWLCTNNTSSPVVRVPFPIEVTLSLNPSENINQITGEYQMYECGGVLKMIDVNLNISAPSMPATYLGKRVECAWAIWPDDFTAESSFDSYGDDYQYEISLSTDFKGKCDEQYLIVYNGLNQNYPHLGRYCGTTPSTNLLATQGIFIEYYSSSYEVESKMNITMGYGSGCGGKLSYPYRPIIFSKQYVNNVECIWEITADSGFHVGLWFEGRFFIESSENCKKDYLKVQQKTHKGNWEDIQTICGRTPPKSVNTTTNVMRLIFRSDNETTGDGFIVHFDRNCGGLLYSTEEIQTISSPGYPILYKPNLYCNYTVLPEEQGHGGVLVQMEYLNVEDTGVAGLCIFDNVTITSVNDKDDTNTMVICGTKTGYSIRAKESISITLRTDNNIPAKGFQFRYSYDVCGGEVTNTSIIESPKDHRDDTFPPELNCRWNITAPDGYKILIKFEKLDMESHSMCEYDYVEVFKGSRPTEDVRLAKLCGKLNGKLPTISVSTNQAVMRSATDNSGISRGFKALVTFKRNCDREIFLDVSNSTFTFNTFSGAGYINNLDCVYIFKTNSNRQLTIDFMTFHIENSIDCQKDYLEIRDGPGPFADIIGTFCGHTIPSKLISTRNVLFMRFVSDSQETSAGFTSTIGTSPLQCGDGIININETEIVKIASPMISSGSPPQFINCLWRIKAQNVINLRFDKLNINQNDTNKQCEESYLKIYSVQNLDAMDNGYSHKVIINDQLQKTDWSDFATEHVYCGNKVPDDYYSQFNELFVQYVLKQKTPSDASFSLTATSPKGCFRNFTDTQGRIYIKSTAEVCNIYISVPKNYTISLYYGNVVFPSSDCSSESVQVFDAHTNTSLERICNYLEPGKSLFTNTNELRIQLAMAGYYNEFDITYLASKYSPGCNGVFYNTAGTLTNPFYPNNVRESANCTWMIVVPNNLHVLLKFIAFDLGAKTTCESDYLQILEMESEDKPLVPRRQYCGGDNPKYYKSKVNKVIIRFIKTANYDGTGWALSFNGVYENYVVPLN